MDIYSLDLEVLIPVRILAWGEVRYEVAVPTARKRKDSPRLHSYFHRSRESLLIGIFDLYSLLILKRVKGSNRQGLSNGELPLSCLF